MKIEKLKVSPESLEINFKFYLFLKEINGSNGLTVSQVLTFIRLLSTHIDKEAIQVPDQEQEQIQKIHQLLDIETDKIKSEDKRNNIKALALLITNRLELEIFSFALKLIYIKPLLLAEAKIVELKEISNATTSDLLTLKYDQQSKHRPFYTRVNGALLSLLFFDNLENKKTRFLSEDTDEVIQSLASEFEYLKRAGIEPNQIFMLMFTESINQSIISDAGSNYEDRILECLVALGIDKDSIKKVHDSADSSTEFDFFFEIGGKTYGIGAKRTLRERYKQFIKTASMSSIDVMIEITLGIDLTEEKAKAIRNHNVFLFVADEIYESRSYLRSIGGIFPTSKLDLNTLAALGKNSKKVKR